MSPPKVPSPSGAPGTAVRDARLRARGPGTTLRLIVLLAVVAGVAVLVLRSTHHDRSPFRVVDATVARGDGEGLMGKRRTLRQEPLETRPGATGPYAEALRGPGSTVMGFAELRLDPDAPAVRVRQQGTRIDEDVEEIGPDGKTVKGGDEPGLRWHGWVAREPEDYGAGARVGTLPWRNAGGESGVLVRPGERVRLRTRYDVPASSARRCSVEIRGGGEAWEVREAADAETSTPRDWKPLRARPVAGPLVDAGADADVLTGQIDRVGFRIGRPGCEDNAVIGDSGTLGGP